MDVGFFETRWGMWWGSGLGVEDLWFHYGQMVLLGFPSVIKVKEFVTDLLKYKKPFPPTVYP